VVQLEEGPADSGWAKGRPDSGAVVKIAEAILDGDSFAGRRWELGLGTTGRGFVIVVAERCVVSCSVSNHLPDPRRAPNYCPDAEEGSVEVQGPSRLARSFGRLPDYRRGVQGDCCGVEPVEGGAADEGCANLVPECPARRYELGMH
jgi:hypothetical protein